MRLNVRKYVLTPGGSAPALSAGGGGARAFVVRMVESFAACSVEFAPALHEPYGALAALYDTDGHGGTDDPSACGSRVRFRRSRIIRTRGQR
jgi:hypothetical protein